MGRTGKGEGWGGEEIESITIQKYLRVFKGKAALTEFSESAPRVPLDRRVDHRKEEWRSCSDTPRGRCYPLASLSVFCVES